MHLVSAPDGDKIWCNRGGVNESTMRSVAIQTLMGHGTHEHIHIHSLHTHSLHITHTHHTHTWARAKEHKCLAMMMMIIMTRAEGLHTFYSYLLLYLVVVFWGTSTHISYCAIASAWGIWKMKRIMKCIVVCSTHRHGMFATAVFGVTFFFFLGCCLCTKETDLLPTTELRFWPFLHHNKKRLSRNILPVYELDD